MHIWLHFSMKTYCGIMGQSGNKRSEFRFIFSTLFVDVTVSIYSKSGYIALLACWLLVFL